MEYGYEIVFTKYELRYDLIDSIGNWSYGVHPNNDIIPIFSFIGYSGRIGIFMKLGVF